MAKDLNLFNSTPSWHQFSNKFSDSLYILFKLCDLRNEKNTMLTNTKYFQALFCVIICIILFIYTKNKMVPKIVFTAHAYGVFSSQQSNSLISKKKNKHMVITFKAYLLGSRPDPTR